MSSLTNISSLDSQYSNQTNIFSRYLSESALIKYRLTIEIEYLIALGKSGIPIKITSEETQALQNIIKNFTEKDFEEVKEIENKTDNDMEAVELKLRKKFKEAKLEKLIEYIHFCLTSEDVNNLAYRLMFQDALIHVLIPIEQKLVDILIQLSEDYACTAMMARTQGQDAVPTTFGKEIAVFKVRLQNLLNRITYFKLSGKLNGAVGNWNSFHFVKPDKEWMKFSVGFIKGIGLTPVTVTTQINHFDDVIEFVQMMQRFNEVLRGLDIDMWRYISDGWINLKVDKNSVGSSTMAQKVNPIDFENSEGNCQMANGNIEIMTRTLLVSRLQRDLSNSTIIRNISSIFAYSYLAAQSTLSGLEKILPNEVVMKEYLLSNWAILAEALQTELRFIKHSNAYEEVKQKVMGKKLDEKGWKDLVSSLKIPAESKEKLKALTPLNYLGYAEKLAI